MEAEVLADVCPLQAGSARDLRDVAVRSIDERLEVRALELVERLSLPKLHGHVVAGLAVGRKPYLSHRAATDALV